MSSDVEQAKRLYANTLGWCYVPMEMPDGTYWLIEYGEATVGGMFESSEPRFDGVPKSWMAHIAVDGVASRIAKASAAGGTSVRSDVDVPGVGRIGIIREPREARICWLTPAQS